MADIEIVCPKCSGTVMVSEFADLEAVACPSCNTKINKPQTQSTEATSQTQRKLRIRESKPVVTEDVREAAAVSARIPERSEREYARKPFAGPILSWVIFIVLGSAAGFLRYGGDFLVPYADIISSYGPFVIIAVHIIIILKAFRDSVFQGVLCLLLPLYSFYYLFVMADDFLTRAIVGALLVGIGQDSLYVIQREIIEAIDVVQAWIASGG